MLPDSRAKTHSLVASSIVAGYGEHVILSGTSVATESGRIVAVVGPNGAGKSTLLKTLTGELHLRSGHIQLNGEDVHGLSSEALVRRGMGYIPQSRDVFDGLRVSENLHMGGYTLDKKSLRGRVDEVLDLFPPLRRLLRSRAGHLSGGEKKMLAIARALVPDPAVLLLDEPASGLSPFLTNRLLQEQITALAELGKAVLIVEQKAEAALQVAHYAYVLAEGVVAMEGPGQEVLNNPQMRTLFLGGEVRSPASS